MRLPDLGLHGRPRVAWLAGLALIALALVAVAGAAVIRMSSAHHEHTPNHAPGHQSPPAAAASGHRHDAASPVSQGGTAVAHEVARLGQAPHVDPATSTAYPPIDGPATRQPDLFARAFASRLLTQDYRTPRRNLLQWVQAESATTTEPTVIGLVPQHLRSRWALYSLTTDQDTPVIPTRRDWQLLARQHGHTTVKIQDVSEPLAWSQAVLAGKITDPGITAREIDALITLHTTTHGKPRTTINSVALTLNLEGPPAREDYRFVTAITYHLAPGAPR